MRVLYSTIWWLALPIVFMRLWWRGRGDAGYRQHILERFAIYQTTFPFSSEKLIWIHAVSVGETRAAEPVIHSLFSSSPNCSILLTHMTPTGRATGKALYSKYERKIVQAYLPYDMGWLMGRFLKHFSPRLCILMETEVWPNMIAQCRKHHVPVLLANARLSERSFRKALRLPGLFRQAANGIACAAAQTEADAVRLKELGVRTVQVTGSMKFDVTPPQFLLDSGAQLKRQIGARKVLLCASTREGEEALILDALEKHNLSDALLMIVPRHPQRFDDVESLIQAKGLRMCRRSALNDAQVPSDVDVILGDTMGEMFAYYAACDLAFIGGSLLPLGGQNLIEACAVGKPVLIGPHTFNFSAATENAIEAGAAMRVADEDAMFVEAARLLKDDERRNAMGANARRYAEQHRGATQKTIALLQRMLDESSHDEQAA
ncbi:lipid IV(A) 3-deoxy-D-manno-octulosonic acid transferase [Oxalobacteraceae bacterium R-40]|uniref:3-deoxy-D-manno-octulosonic acid transferase n=1 Tax=Keguizhuia sedimenti TaxID=3064264 RepID=A0ABU1BM99_9BURK|nr:lipid IV(A) 3-deoxy-D-manno-octulosonic acid transferase [Oxalobacteraceae bacterium R-40]